MFQKRSGEGGKQSTSVKKSKKDKGTGPAGKNMRPEPNVVSVAPRVKPELALPVMYFPKPLVKFHFALCSWIDVSIIKSLNSWGV